VITVESMFSMNSAQATMSGMRTARRKGLKAVRAGGCDRNRCRNRPSMVVENEGKTDALTFTA
jgi:hypothetical protein